MTVSFQQLSKLAFPKILLLPEIPAKCDNLQGKQSYYDHPGGGGGWNVTQRCFPTAARDT